LNERHIGHILLLHHNLTSALFLNDLIEAFTKEGWDILDAEQAFQDEIFLTYPTTIPAGPSLIWSLTKETGLYNDLIRYPAEDSQYKAPKMDSLGL
jgi:hypothetical protein